jgi:hypothetical protein
LGKSTKTIKKPKKQFIMDLNDNLNQSPLETLDQFDDELWVELILKSPKSVDNICLMLSLDIQLELENTSQKSKLIN